MGGGFLLEARLMWGSASKHWVSRGGESGVRGGYGADRGPAVHCVAFDMLNSGLTVVSMLRTNSTEYRRFFYLPSTFRSTSPQ